MKDRFLSRTICFLSVVITSIGLAHSSPVSADSPPQPSALDARGSPDTPHLSEIIVTATRSSELLERAPVAVVVISRDELQNNDATDLSKLAEVAPQVIIGQYSSGTGSIMSMRGIGTDPADAGLSESVLTVLDGVPIGTGRVIGTSLFDVQQVQVIEGPQGLFFGKDADAGVIAIQSADPTSKLTGYVKGGYEFIDDEPFGEGAISGPITDTLKARFAFRASHIGGWMKNVASPVSDPLLPGVTTPGAPQGNTQPAGNDYAGRLTFLWTPADGFSANLKLTYDDETWNGLNAFWEPYCTGGDTTPIQLGVPEVGADCNKNQVVGEGALPPQFAVNIPFENGGIPYQYSKFVLGALTLKKDLKTISLISTTGYYNQDHSGFGTDYGPYPELTNSDHNRYTLVTEEVRVNSKLSGPINFMAGGYFDHEDRQWYNGADILTGTLLNPAVGNYNTFETAATGNGNYYSLFGELRINIISSVELDAGARYSHYEKDATLTDITVNPDAALLGLSLYPPGTPLAVHTSGHNLSPQVTLTWHPRENESLYAAYRTGFKSGGISNPAILYAYNDPSNLTFRPEKTHGFEIGFKSDFLNRALRTDLSIYRYTYSNLQVVSFDSRSFSFLIGNAGASLTEGAEASFQWLAYKDLTFDGSVGYNHAHYLNFPNAQCYPGQTLAQGCAGGLQDLADKPLTNAPLLNLRVGGDYRARIVPGWLIDMSVHGTYSSSYNASTYLSPEGVQRAYWLLDAALNFIPDNSNFEIAIIGRDLTNTYYMVDSIQLGLTANNDYVGLFNRPREVIFQIGYHF